MSLFFRKKNHRLNKLNKGLEDLGSKTVVVESNNVVGHSALPKGSTERYEFKKILGSGSYGMVYLVRDCRLNRLIAMKCLNKAFQNARGKALFFEEARVIASIDHDNVVIIYDVEDITDQSYITMEYLSSGNLQERIAKNKVIKEHDAVIITKGIIEGIVAVHSKDIIHGDIKPANILFGPRGRPKLVDFGIASLYRDYQGEKFLGTPAYMSPEQIDKLENLDERIDIYAIGLVYFEMLTGQRYHTHKIIETTKEMESFYIDRIDNECQNITEKSKKILKKLLEKDRNSRYQTAQQVLFDLEEYPLSKINIEDFLPQHHQDNEHLLREVMEILLIEGKESIAQKRELKKRARVLGVSEERSNIIRKEVLKNLTNEEKKKK